MRVLRKPLRTPHGLDYARYHAHLVAVLSDAVYLLPNFEVRAGGLAQVLEHVLHQNLIHGAVLPRPWRLLEVPHHIRPERGGVVYVDVAVILIESASEVEL